MNPQKIIERLSSCDTRTMHTIAGKIGVSVATLYRIKAGADPKVSVLAKLAGWFERNTK